MSQISIIVPVYKTEKYLSRCIDSVLNQTFTDFDLILIDDGSPDKSGEICDEYAKRDQRIVVLHQENKGAASARNNGIEYALNFCNSRWISFIDSDDWVFSDYLEIMLNAAQESECLIAVCGYRKTDDTKIAIDNVHYKKRMVQAEEFIFENDIWPVVPWGKLYDKDLWSIIRYPEGKICEDEYVTYKVMLESKQIIIIDKPLYMYFQNQQSVMNSRWSTKRLDGVDAHCERFVYLSKYYPAVADRALLQIWKDCRYQGQNALLFLNGVEQQEVFDYLNQIMNKYKLPWDLLISQEPKEVCWMLLQKTQLKMTCRLRNIMSVGF